MMLPAPDVQPSEVAKPPRSSAAPAATWTQVVPGMAPAAPCRRVPASQLAGSDQLLLVALRPVQVWVAGARRLSRVSSWGRRQAGRRAAARPRDGRERE